MTNFASNLRIPLAEDEQIVSDKVEPETIARPIVSSLDTWDFATQIETFNNSASIGKRQGWNIPSIGVMAESVNTVRSSSFTRFVSPTMPNQAAKAFNPVTMSPQFTVVPNMAQNLFVDAEAQVNFSVLVSSLTVTSPAFAVFRDGRKISQEYRQQVTPGQQSLVTGSYVDTGAEIKRYHVYDLRWRSPDSVQITAFEKNRTFQASNLRAV